MDEELVTIAEYRSYLAAIAAREALRDAGIDCFLPELRGDTDTRYLYQPFTGVFDNAISIQVGRADAERALAVLQEADTLTEDGQEPDPYANGPPPCPECESVETHAAQPSLLMRLALFTIPSPTGARCWECAECGHKWRQ